MNTRSKLTMKSAVALMAALSAQLGAAQQANCPPGSPCATITIDGKQLPAPPQKFEGVMKESLEGSKPWWPATIVPPKGAPNILLVMTDDAGYGISSTFGGVIPTPALDRIAQHGLRYTMMHSTALCSPTRAALITGRNHHDVGYGVIAEIATGYPGYDGIIPLNKATIGTILKDNGYATAWFGKDHNTPAWVQTTAGPFDLWPSGYGFDYFYGFPSGETNQWHPFLFRNHTATFPWVGKPGWNLITGMADDAIEYMRYLKTETPGRPWFIYYVPGGTHSPHNPTQEWIDKISAMHPFDGGWNKLRETIFANQKKLGVIPANAKLTAWPTDPPASLPEWDKIPAADKKLYIKQADVFGAYVAYTDHEIGRVIQEVDDEGLLNNTLIIYIEGDNGTSAEGSLTGTFNDLIPYNGATEIPLDINMKFYDVWGLPPTDPHMTVNWAWAFDTPFKWVKEVASHFGGTRQGMAISWPGHINDEGGIRGQFCHVNDIVPTILEESGIPMPEYVDGIKQEPMDGTSLAYTFDKANANAPTRHHTQYFEMFGHRGIYHDGWYANTQVPIAPWSPVLGVKFPNVLDYKWELYNLEDDYSQYNDLAAKYPDKLKELQDLFVQQAWKNNVFPMSNSVFARLLEPRPSSTGGETVFTYQGVMPGINTFNAPSTIARSFTITADIEVPKGGVEGMIVTDGGETGGWGFYILKSTPVFTYNLLGVERFRWAGQQALTPGKHTVEFDFTYDGPGPAKGGTGILKVDGAAVDTKKIPKTVPFAYTDDETFDVGMDTRSGVNDADYHVPFAFTGTIVKVVVKPGPMQLLPEDQKRATEAKEKIND